jgi:hypothetical protein
MARFRVYLNQVGKYKLGLKNYEIFIYKGANMSMSDVIADMLTRIRNAHLVNKKSVDIPASNLKVNIAKVMQQEGYIESFSVDGELPEKKIKIILKCYEMLL